MSKTLIGMGSAAMDSIICCSSLPGDDSFQVVDSEQLLPGGSCANSGSSGFCGGEKTFSCIINLIIILIVLQFLTQLLCNNSCDSCC